MKTIITATALVLMTMGSAHADFDWDEAADHFGALGGDVTAQMEIKLPTSDEVAATGSDAFDVTSEQYEIGG